MWTRCPSSTNKYATFCNPTLFSTLCSTTDAFFIDHQQNTVRFPAAHRAQCPTTPKVSSGFPDVNSEIPIPSQPVSPTVPQTLKATAQQPVTSIITPSVRQLTMHHHFSCQLFLKKTVTLLLHRCYSNFYYSIY